MKNLFTFIIVIFIIHSTDSIAQSQLIDAIKNSNYIKAKELIRKHSADVNETDENGATVLMWAVGMGNLNFVKYLADTLLAKYTMTKRVIYLDSNKNSYIGSLSAIAAAKGDLSMLKYLIENLKINVNDREYSPLTKSETGWMPLQWAVYMGRDKVADYLINQKNADDTITDELGNTLLLLSLNRGNGNPLVCEIILKKNHSKEYINQCNNLQLSPLHLAIYDSAVKIVKLLLNNGADVNKICYDSINYHKLFLYETPLTFAISHSKTLGSEFAGIIINSIDTDKINVPDSFGYSPLINAIYENNPEIVEMLIKKGANVNQRIKPTPLYLQPLKKKLDEEFHGLYNDTSLIKYFTTPLCIALEKKYFKIAELLIKYGAKYDYLLNLYCGSDKSTETFNWLIEHCGINKNLQDTLLGSPLFQAIANNNISEVKRLISYGANINEINSQEGITPIFWAITFERDSILEILIDSGANINFKNKDSLPPLGFAINISNANAAKILISKGANLNIKYNKSGSSTAMVLSFDRKLNDILKLLINSSCHLCY